MDTIMMQKILMGIMIATALYFIYQIYRVILLINNRSQTLKHDLDNLKRENARSIELITAQHAKRMESAIELALSAKGYDYKKLPQISEGKPIKKRNRKKKEK